MKSWGASTAARPALNAWMTPGPTAARPVSRCTTLMKGISLWYCATIAMLSSREPSSTITHCTGLTVCRAMERRVFSMYLASSLQGETST